MLKKLLFFIAVLTASPVGATEVPKLLGHINDYAHTLNPTVISELNSKLDTAETTLPNRPQIVFYTLPRLPDENIDTFANTVYKAWFSDTKAENGVLVLYAPGSRRLHVKVGNNLNSAFTDEVIGKITGSARSYVRADSNTMVIKVLTDKIINQLQSVPVTTSSVTNTISPEPVPTASESVQPVDTNVSTQISPEFRVSQTDLDYKPASSSGISPFIVIPGVVLMFFACLVGFVVYSDWAKSRAYKKEYDEFVAKHKVKKPRSKPKTVTTNNTETKSVSATKRSPPAKKKRKPKVKTPVKETGKSTENN